QCKAKRINLALTIKIRAPLTIKIKPTFTINVPSSFAFACESDREGGMNPILFMIGGWPVHITDVVIGFAVSTLLLLLTITTVVARSGRREAAHAMMQSARADEMEQRLNEMMRSQAEASGRFDAVAQALAGRQADMARAVNERLDSVTHRV